jgi:nicotinamidase-related amidase
VRQEFSPDLSDASLEIRQHKMHVTISGTPGCQLLPELERSAGETEIIKKRYSAFFGTNLQERLSAHACDCLVVAGINTHACVRMTIIDAYQLDYQVIAADECIASHDTEHHAVTKRYLNGKMASFQSNRDILATILPNNSLPPIAPKDGAPAD